MRKFLVMFAITFLASWQTMLAANGHFITDAAYRTKVETAFKQKVNLVGKQFYDQKMLKQQKATADEQGALQFLYAYMPVADVTDYPTSFFLENVRTSFEARQQMAWGNKVPELLFRHFVLPVRINNENLGRQTNALSGAAIEASRMPAVPQLVPSVGAWMRS